MLDQYQFQKMKPLFSIGVTTYNRNDLLKECLNSILRQNFEDFEVIIGNDYIQQAISADILGIRDPRIRIVNYPENIGPIANANTLLAMSRGKYFTLLADDDLHTVHYLQAMHDSLLKYDYPLCIFSSFTSNIDIANNVSAKDIGEIAELELLTGRQFLTRYLSRDLETIGCYGVFDIAYLRGVGGISQLGDGRSMYAEMPLVILSGLLENVVYLRQPLVFFRSHPGSLCNTSTDVEAYMSSQRALFEKCIAIFNEKAISDDFQRNIFLLLKWCIQDVATVMRRSGSIHFSATTQYITFLKQIIEPLKYSLYYWKCLAIMISIPLKNVAAALARKIWGSLHKRPSR